jgi:hypothetical protein
VPQSTKTPKPAKPAKPEAARSFRLPFANGTPVGPTGQPLGLAGYATVSETRREPVAGRAWRWVLTNARAVTAGAPPHVAVVATSTPAERAAGHGATVQLDRLLLGLKPRDGKRARHLNRDRLDCRDANLREADAAAGAFAPRPLTTAPPAVIRPRGRRNRLGLVGVAKSDSAANPYLAVTWVPGVGKGSGRRVYLGLFPTASEAALAHDLAATELRGTPPANAGREGYTPPPGDRALAVAAAVKTRLRAVAA